jgi:hypothetical protein
MALPFPQPTFFGDRIHQELLTTCRHHVRLPGIGLQSATYARDEQ